MSNNEKHMSDNKLIGVLPPGIINNIKLCDIYKPHGKYRLKSGLKINKDYYVINHYLWEWFLLNYGGGPEISVEGYNSSQFCVEEDAGKTENIIDNNGSVFTYLRDDTSNIGCSELNPNMKDVTTNKINPINNYNFNTKFSEFRVNNLEGNNKKHNEINEKAEESNENKENVNQNIMNKKSQIKTLIRNINIDDNKY